MTRWAWGVSTYYTGRLHVLVPRTPNGVCGLPVQQIYPHRPPAPPLCPECALELVARLFPASQGPA
ncbi:hypothetical protein [Actinokineospora sp. NBRC 105648]|uniref:hypothetical protein n=1 Tax=Actinokineospora sp. NBRC 105648 TaxID=3032206 RepID=UPI0024A1743F|nr:hypothetical protein [Actinokineospora sp. NBRC 105648]GLZ41117.1 hypothetical protein Acsp05_47410 [Actinokineospora sp. NBRC 105648]